MKRFKVTFKEAYLSYSVTRECYVRSREEVVTLYGLEGPDIEWYKIEEIC